jgi:hypothetical protein
VKVGLGLDGNMATWGCLLAQAEGGFGPRWHFDCIGCFLAQSEGEIGPRCHFGCMGVPFSPG